MSISKLKDEARRHEQKEEWDKAINAYLQVLRIGDGAGDVELPLYNRIGDLCVRLGRPDDAVRYYEQAADRYAEVGLYNNAIALCNKALRYRPDHIELLRKLGQFSALQGFLSEARGYFVEYADQQIRTGHPDAAFAALTDFANIVDDGDTRELLGQRLRSQGRDGEAVAELQRAYALYLQAGNTAAAQAVAADILAIEPGATLTDAADADGGHGEGTGFADAGELPRLDDFALPTIMSDTHERDEAGEFAGDTDRDVEPAIDDDGFKAASDAAMDSDDTAITDEAATPEANDFGGFVGGIDSDTEMYGVMRFGSESEHSVEAEAGDADSATVDDAATDGEFDVEGLESTTLDFGSASSGLMGLDLGLDFDGVPGDADIVDPASRGGEDDVAAGVDDGAFDDTDYGLPLLDDEPPAHGLPLLDDAGPAGLGDFGPPDVDEAEHPSAPWRIGEVDDEAGYEHEPDAGSVDDGDESSSPADEFDSALFDAAAFDVPVIRGRPSEAVDPGVPADGFDSPADPVGDWIAGPLPADARTPVAGADADATDAVPGESALDAKDPSTAEPDAEFPPGPAELESGDPAAPPASAHGAVLDRPDVADSLPAPPEDAAGAAEAGDLWTWEPSGEPEPDESAPAGLTSASDEDTAWAENRDGERPADADPADPADRIAAAGYVDLGELLREDRQDTTRFQMAEAEPTGDEDRDFAELLGQFRARLSEHLPVEDAAAHYDLALAFKEMGLLDEAIAEFQVSLRGGYSRLRIYEELGSCFLQKEEYAIAVKVLNQALRVERTDDLDLLGVYYHLGRAYEAMGQAPQAREAYEHVLAMDISFQDVSERLERL